MAETKTLILAKSEDRRLRAGHLWIYSNEIDSRRTPLASFRAGEAVAIHSSSDQFIGYGYVNPQSLIAARLLSRDRRYPIDTSLFVHRLQVALALRQRLFAAPCYRLVHGEGDLLPGLVIDRFNDIFVVQLNTAGMAAQQSAVVAALEKLFQPRAIIMRNDSALRELEGLPRMVEVVAGDAPDSVEMEENGLKWRVPLIGGQKTGWFYDHRANRAELKVWVKGQRVLDLFSYLGGWGVTAAAFGATSVTLIDSSAAATAGARVNAALNGVAERVTALTGDVFELLKELRGEGVRYDVVIADPPAFIKRRKDHRSGLEAYHRLNQAAMQMLDRDGLLVTASCSYHLAAGELRSVVQGAARHLDRDAQIIGQGYQAADHPIHPAIVETDYIKALFVRVTR
jgi:23S rRNA (cytosine1962-C5)-methyltransferase